jgi:anthranilate phosphoribosyltransferase
MLKSLIKKMLLGEDLIQSEIFQAMTLFANKEASSEQISFFLGVLSAKGESPEEIAAFASFMQNHSQKIALSQTDAIDLCGTGGDGCNTFNISTASVFVAAGAGAIIAKHGNRSVSSKSGSADVLEALGVNLSMNVKNAIDKTGIGFIFAPLHHPVMKNLKELRVAINIPTVLNLLGPLTNHADVKRQIIGVYDGQKALNVVEALKISGAKEVMVVHSDDGLDEISISAATTVYHLKNNEIKKFVINPENYGIKKSSLDSIKGGDAKENAAIITRILNGLKSPARDIVVLNSAAALIVAGIAKDFAEGVKLANESLDTKKALAKLEALRQCS